MKFTFKVENKNLPRREREKAKHRQEIFNAAIKVFARKGFYPATLEEVAKEAEFSKGAIYTYFSNKEDLLFQIMENKLGFIGDFIQDLLSCQKSFKEELMDLLIGTTELAAKNPDFCKLLMNQHAQHFKSMSDENKLKLKQIHDKYHVILVKRIQKAMDDGEIKALPPDVISEMIIGALNSIVNFHWHHGTLKKVTPNCRIFVELLFDGIAKKP